MTEGSDFWCPDGTQSTIVKPNPGRKGEWSVKIFTQAWSWAEASLSFLKRHIKMLHNMQLWYEGFK